MLRMAQIKYIKDLYENEEASLREICRITGHSFETVRKYAYQENWSEDNLPDIEPQSYPVLQDFIPIIDKWLEEDRKAPRALTLAKGPHLSGYSKGEHLVLGKNIAHDMKSGAEGAHFFGALLLTFSFDKHTVCFFFFLYH